MRRSTLSRRRATSASDAVSSLPSDFPIGLPMAKIPRPQKPPIKPIREGQDLSQYIGLRHERLLGRLITSWSLLEQALENLIWLFLDIRVEYGRVITAKMDASSRVQKLKSFASLEFEGDELNEIKSILGMVDVAREDRNFAMHAVWGSVSPGLTPIAFSLRTNHDPGAIVGETFPHTRTTALIELIQDLTRQLENCQKRLISKERKLAPRPIYESAEIHPPNPGDQPPEDTPQ